MNSSKRHSSRSWTSARQWLNICNAYTQWKKAADFRNAKVIVCLCLWCMCEGIRRVKALHTDASSSLCTLKHPLVLFLSVSSVFTLKTNCSPSSPPRRAEVDKVCERWNVFDKRQPVTMDLLCVYPDVTSILSRCVYYCWSLLESIWVLGFGRFNPSQEQYSFLLWPGHSAGIASLLHSHIEPWHRSPTN